MGSDFQPRCPPRDFLAENRVSDSFSLFPRHGDAERILDDVLLAGGAKLRRPQDRLQTVPTPLQKFNLSLDWHVHAATLAYS